MESSETKQKEIAQWYYTEDLYKMIIDEWKKYITYNELEDYEGMFKCLENIFEFLKFQGLKNKDTTETVEKTIVLKKGLFILVSEYNFLQVNQNMNDMQRIYLMSQKKIEIKEKIDEFRNHVQFMITELNIDIPKTRKDERLDIYKK